MTALPLKYVVLETILYWLNALQNYGFLILQLSKWRQTCLKTLRLTQEHEYF